MENCTERLLERVGDGVVQVVKTLVGILATHSVTERAAWDLLLELWISLALIIVHLFLLRGF